MNVRHLPTVELRQQRELWQACVRGEEPAESLEPWQRENLVAELVGRGWSDLQIALHTRMSLYTTVRIRRRLELAGAS